MRTVNYKGLDFKIESRHDTLLLTALKLFVINNSKKDVNEILRCMFYMEIISDAYRYDGENFVKE